jgi:putative transcriptional regulator
MKEKLFAELMRSAGQALEHARGKRELRTTVLPAPPRPMKAGEIRSLRGTLNASQAVFARYCNVSTKLVQAWDADRRRPSVFRKGRFDVTDRIRDQKLESIRS